MIWLVLASLLLGPFPEQILVWHWRGLGNTLSAPMPADQCFEKAAALTRHVYRAYGPYQFMELEMAFCITPDK